MWGSKRPISRGLSSHPAFLFLFLTDFSDLRRKIICDNPCYLWELISFYLRPFITPLLEWGVGWSLATNNTDFMNQINSFVAPMNSKRKYWNLNSNNVKAISAYDSLFKIYWLGIFSFMRKLIYPGYIISPGFLIFWKPINNYNYYYNHKSNSHFIFFDMDCLGRVKNKSSESYNWSW